MVCLITEGRDVGKKRFFCLGLAFLATSGLAQENEGSGKVGRQAIAAMDLNHDGKVGEKEFVIFTLKKGKEAFLAADRNNDGFITQDEYAKTAQAHPMTNRLIDTMDLNHDGKVGIVEWETWQRAQAKKRFAALDLDKNGYLDESDFSGLGAKIREGVAARFSQGMQKWQENRSLREQHPKGGWKGWKQNPQGQD